MYNIRSIDLIFTTQLLIKKIVDILTGLSKVLQFTSSINCYKWLQSKPLHKIDFDQRKRNVKFI